MTPLIHTGIFAEPNDGDVNAPQDSQGDPNLSGISPPLPLSLVELQLHACDTGFYVITAGLEVGITTLKYVHFTLLTVFFFTLFQRNCRLAPRLPKSIIPNLLDLETSKIVL